MLHCVHLLLSDEPYCCFLNDTMRALRGNQEAGQINNQRKEAINVHKSKAETVTPVASCWLCSTLWPLSHPSRASVCKLVPLGSSHTRMRIWTSSLLLTPPTQRWRWRLSPPLTSSTTPRRPLMSPACHRPTTGRPAELSLIRWGGRPAGEEILDPEWAWRTIKSEQTDQNLETDVDEIIRTGIIFIYRWKKQSASHKAGSGDHKIISYMQNVKNNRSFLKYLRRKRNQFYDILLKDFYQVFWNFFLWDQRRAQ